MTQTSKPTFTPGPWTVEDAGPNGNHIIGNNAVIGTLPCWPVCSDEAQANATLIASAPDMLAALERFAEAMKQRSYPELQGIACDAFAALAKAKGGQP